MNRTAIVIASLVSAAWAGTASAQQVSLTLRDGRATLVTQNASVRQILAEWERQGRVRILGAERLATSQPLTITLNDVTERQALDIVLRGVPGYMAVDRAEAVAGASRYDRLVLLARTTTPVAQTAAAAATPTPQPAFTQPAYAQPMDPAMTADVGNVDVQPYEDADQPMPTAPVVNPYPNAAGGGAGGGAMPGGSAVLSSGSPNGSPETQFDYANPQRYFDAMRQRQQQQQATQPGMTPAPVAPYPGSTLDTTATTTTATPSGVPTVTGTSARPGIAPAPTTPPQQQQFFNPYNLPPEQLNGNPSSTTTTPPTSVEPDRSKYANPYVPAPTTKPPQ
jgi:hypothetical protein